MSLSQKKNHPRKGDYTHTVSIVNLSSAKDLDVWSHDILGTLWGSYVQILAFGPSLILQVDPHQNLRNN
jgi:hypothetical protein